MDAIDDDLDLIELAIREGIPRRADSLALVAEVRALRAGIRALHVPRDEEVERYHGDFPEEGDLDGECPDPGALGGCAGHIETVQVCRECGHDNDGDSAFFRPWPCPTVALLDGEGPS